MGLRRAWVVCVGLAACGGGGAAPDATVEGPLDAAPYDAAAPDAIPPDAMPPDAIAIDAMPVDAAPPCDSVTLNPTSGTYSGAAHDAVTIDVTTTPATGCNWTATTSDPWITVVTSSGDGTGTLVYDVAANDAQHASRDGAIDVSGQTLSITQDGAPCTFTITPPQQDVPAAGGAYSATVDPSFVDCDWTPTPDSTWITVTDPSPRIGSGTIDYTIDVLAHNEPQRSGRIDVPGAFLTIAQSQP